MKTFKISKKNNEVLTTAPIIGGTITLSGNDLCLRIERDASNDLSVGDKINFVKTAEGNDGNVTVYQENSTITQIIEGEDGYRYIYFDYIYIKPLTVASFFKIKPQGEDGYKYKFYFTTDHFMVPYDTEDGTRYDFHDYTLDEGYVLYVRRGGNTMCFGDLALCFPSEIVSGATVRTEENGCCAADIRPFNYDTMERNAVLAKKVSPVASGGTFVPDTGDQVLFCTNPFFYIDDSGNTVFFKNVELRRYTDFLGLGVVLEEDYDAKRLFQEYQVNEQFVKKIKSSIIPDFIDLEKIKYAPAFCEVVDDGGTTGDTSDDKIVTWLATGLTFNLHFR